MASLDGAGYGEVGGFMSHKTYDVVIERNPEGGYTATVPALPGCISEGDTKAEARSNVREAIQLYLETWGEEAAEGEASFAGMLRVKASA